MLLDELALATSPMVADRPQTYKADSAYDRFALSVCESLPKELDTLVDRWPAAASVASLEVAQGPHGVHRSRCPTVNKDLAVLLQLSMSVQGISVAVDYLQSPGIRQSGSSIHASLLNSHKCPPLLQQGPS